MKTLFAFIRIAGPLVAVLALGLVVIAWLKHPNAGIIASCAIAAMSLGYFVMFRLETNGIERGIAQFEGAILKGESQSVPKSVPMAPIFNDYLKNLVGDPKAPTRFSRLPAEEYFNQRTMLETQLNLPFYQGLPNIIVGVGILFTFLGLAMALQAAGEGVTAADPTKMKESLNELFRAASFKFITSIAGLGCSMLFSIAEKHRLQTLADRWNGLCDTLNKRFTVFRFDEAMLREIKLVSNQDANRSLTEAAKAMQSAADGMNAQLSSLAGLQRSLSPEAIGQQVGIAMQSVFSEQLTPVFKDISVELGALREIKQDQGQEILANLIKELRAEVLEPIAERLDQSAQLTREASEAVRTLSHDLDRVTTKLVETTQTIETFQTNTLERLQEFAQSLREILSQFGGETQGVLQAVASEVHRVVEESLQGLESQRSAFEASAQNAAATFGGLRGDLELAMTAQIEAQQVMLREVQAQMEQLVGRSDEALRQTTGSFQVVVDHSVRALGEQRVAFEASAQDTVDTFRQVREELEGALLQQVSLQQHMLQQVKGEMGEMLSGANTAFRETNVTIQQAVDASVRAMDHQRSQFDTSTQQAATTFERLRQLLAESLQEQANAQARMLEAQTQAQHAMLGEVQGQMEQLVDRSDTTLRATSGAFESVIAQSAEALGHQRDAFQDSSRQTVEAFRQVREDLVASLGAQADTQERMLRSVKSEMGEVLTDANEAFRGTTDAIRQAVDAGVQSMEAQRDAFAESAIDARQTFRGIKEELESALKTQADLEAQRQEALQGRTRELLERVEASFQEQMRTLSGVGSEAATLMNTARENLVAGLSDIQGMLGATSETVRQELEVFRVNYQAALDDFFQQQNTMLESSLGQQREGLASVVLDLQRTFRDEAQGRARMSAEVDEAARQLLETLDRLNQFSAAVGLTTGERLLALQELARETGQQARRVEDAYRGLVGHVQQAMDASNEQVSRYLASAESREKQFFAGYDEAVSKLTDGLMDVAEYLAQAEEHRREAIKS